MANQKESCRVKIKADKKTISDIFLLAEVWGVTWENAAIRLLTQSPLGSLIKDNQPMDGPDD